MKSSILTNCSQRGLTLIEVVAGLALMGTLLAAMLSAKSKFTGQHHHAQLVLTAVTATDDLLMNHWQNIQELERLGGGDFKQHDDLTWTAKRIDDPSATEWYCKILRIQVMDATGSTGDPPLVSVDLLVPDPSAVPPQTESGYVDEEETLDEPSRFAEDEGEFERDLELDSTLPQRGVFP